MKGIDIFHLKYHFLHAGNLQPFPSPETLHPLLVNPPSGLPHKTGFLQISVSPVLHGQCDLPPVFRPTAIGEDRCFFPPGTGRQNSSVRIPAADSFKTATICSSENRFLRMGSSSEALVYPAEIPLGRWSGFTGVGHIRIAGLSTQTPSKEKNLRFSLLWWEFLILILQEYIFKTFFWVS